MVQQLSLNLGLDLVPLSTDEKNVPDLYRIYNAIKLLNSQLDDYAGILGADASLWSVSGSTRITLQNMTRLYCKVNFSALTAGMVVNLWNNAGVLTCQPAGGGGWAGPARGFVLDNYAAGDYAEVFLGGCHNAFSGLTPGAVYYTSTVTAGAITATPPGSPNRQAIGYALSTSSLWFQPALLAI